MVHWEAREATNTLAALGARLKDPRPLWKAVGVVMRGSFRRNFEEGGRPHWQPLKPGTLRSKAAFLGKSPTPPFSKAGKYPLRLYQHGTHGPGSVLIRRGKLRDSYVQSGAEGHVEQIDATGQRFFIGSQLTVMETITPQSVKPYHVLTKRASKRLAKGRKAGGAVPLARFHQEGTSKMPARPQEVQDEDLAAIEEAATKWVLGL